MDRTALSVFVSSWGSLMAGRGRQESRATAVAPSAYACFDLRWLPRRLRESPEVRAFARAAGEVRELLRREQALELPEDLALVPSLESTEPVRDRATRRLRGTDPATLREDAPLEGTAEDDAAVGRILADPAMLPVEAFAAEFGLSRQSVTEMRRRGEVLALPKDKRNWRYPRRQIGRGGILLGLGRVIAELGQGWPAFRFLAAHHLGLGGVSGFEALQAGRIEELERLARGWGSDFA
jgi:hypothetical protein